MIIKILFWINISLLILHEMDAVKTREWKMMVFINKLNDNAGNTVFISLHFFLFMILFYFMEYHFNSLFIAVSVLLILHQFIHLIFMKHFENRMNNIFSQILIVLMSVNSFAGLIYFFIIV